MMSSTSTKYHNKDNTQLDRGTDGVGQGDLDLDPLVECRYEYEILNLSRQSVYI